MPVLRTLLPLGALVTLTALVAAGLTLDVGSGDARAAAATSCDDRALTRAGPWRPVRHRGATLSWSRTPGATLTAPTATAAGGTLSVESGPGRGTLVVRVGGVVAAKVATGAARVRSRTVPFLGRGTVEVSVRRAGRAGVFVDAISLTPAPAPPSPSASPSASPSTSPSPAPLPLGVVLAEVMPDPAAALDSDGEWVELLNTDSDSADLTGCVLTGRSGATSRLAALKVGPGTAIALARSRDQTTNGGVPAAGTFGVPLPNEDGSLALSCSGTVIDTLTWATSSPGVARQLDPAGRWCDATETYNAQDRGTPARVNAACAS